MSIPTEAIEAAARALSPHLFDGRHEAAMRNMPNIFTPERAAESAEAKRNERLGDVELILTAAAPHIQAAALREFAHALTAMITVYAERTTEYDAGWVAGMRSAIAGLTARADQLEGETE